MEPAGLARLLAPSSSPARRWCISAGIPSRRRSRPRSSIRRWSLGSTSSWSQAFIYAVK